MGDKPAVRTEGGRLIFEQSKEQMKAAEGLSQFLFIPRILLTQKSSDIIGAKPEDNPQEIKVGDYTYGPDNDKIGDEMRAMLGPYRPKALLLVNNAVEVESFDPKSAEFIRVKAEAAARKGKGRAYRPLVGPEFLLYVPGIGYGTFFFASTAAPMAKDAFELVGHPVVFTHENRSNVKGQWIVPKVKRFEGKPEEFAKVEHQPDMNEFAEKATAFTEGKTREEDVEKVDDKGKKPRER